MTVLLHNIYRKAIASLLLALLVFIYAEKTFHLHEKAGCTIEQTGISKTSNSGGCSICDFTVAKNAELPEPPGTPNLFTHLSKECVFASIAYHFLADNSTSDRGPPSF